MTHKPPTIAVAKSVCEDIGQWNVGTMFEAGNCAHVIKKIQRYGISILGVSEMRWNSCGRLRVATEYRRNCAKLRMDEGENHERGVGLILRQG